MSTHFYTEPSAAPVPPSPQLEIIYKNFVLHKRAGYHLWKIIPPEGKETHRALSGEWTKIETVKQAIDRFIHEEGFDKAFITPEPPPVKRGRPFGSLKSKATKANEATEETIRDEQINDH